jgi:branched-chain amino acid transport system substrate-binding protein
LTNGDYPTFSRVVPPDSVQGVNDAEYMIDELGVAKVLIVDDQTTYSTGLAESAGSALEDAGVTVETESVSQKLRDFSAIVSGIADDTDAVFLPWQLAASAQQFGEQMAEQGKDAVIVGTDGLFSPDEFKIDGSVVSSFAPDITGIPEDAELVKAYRAEYGDFGTFGPPTYAAATVVMTALKSICDSGEEPTREAVLEAIPETDLAESILGQPIRFDENGDLEGAKFFLFQVENGEYTLVE